MVAVYITLYKKMANFAGHADEAKESPEDSSTLFHLIRHGETYANARTETKAMVDRGDDELNLTGTQQAKDLGEKDSFIDMIKTVDAVLVSPLRRALLTAVTALSRTKVVEAREHRPITLLLEPDLRETNRYQKKGGELYWRHCGAMLSELRAEFEEIISTLTHKDMITIDWESGGEAMENDRVWWDQDQERQQCTTNYEDAHWRAQSEIESLRERCVRNGWKSIALFGHENCFRSMGGIFKMKNTEFLTCRVVAPTTMPVSPRARTLDGDPATALPLTKLVPLALAKDLERRNVTDLVVVLGCSVKREAMLRMRRGVAAMRCHNDCALVYVGSTSTNEYDTILHIMNENKHAFTLRPKEKERVLADQCSKVTECNIDHGLAIAAALRPDAQSLHLVIVTNAWHAPRAALIARDSQLRLDAGNADDDKPAAPCFTFELASTYMDPQDDETMPKHLCDGIHLSSRIAPGGRHAHHWQALLPMLGHELREVGDNMRRWHERNLQLNGGTHASVKENKIKLIRAIKQGDQREVHKILRDALGNREPGNARAAALALVPIGGPNSTALMYCAAHDQPEIARDLILIWGADLNTRNDRGNDWSYWDCPAVQTAVAKAHALVGR